MNGVKPDGNWKIICRGPNGEVKDEIKGHNVVCNNGKEFMASFLNSAAAAASTFTMKYIGVGTDNTAETASDLSLGVELARHTGVVSYVSDQIYQVTATFPTGLAAGAVSEYGLFSSNTNGTMLSRDTEPTITVEAADVLEVVVQLTVS